MQITKNLQMKTNKEYHNDIKTYKIHQALTMAQKKPRNKKNIIKKNKYIKKVNTTKKYKKKNKHWNKFLTDSQTYTIKLTHTRNRRKIYKHTHTETNTHTQRDKYKSVNDI